MAVRLSFDIAVRLSSSIAVRVNSGIAIRVSTIEGRVGVWVALHWIATVCYGNNRLIYHWHRHSRGEGKKTKEHDGYNTYLKITHFSDTFLIFSRSNIEQTMKSCFVFVGIPTCSFFSGFTLPRGKIFGRLLILSHRKVGLSL